MSRVALIVVGAFVLIAGATSEASACGGLICRWCAHHHAAAAARASAYHSAPQQYYVVPASSAGGDAARLSMSDIGTIIGWVEAIRNRRVTPPVTEKDSGSSAADIRALSARLDDLKTTSDRHTREISELVKSESELGNKVGDEIAKLSKRVDDLEPKVEKVSESAATLSTTVAGMEKRIERQALESRRREKMAEKEELEAQIMALGNPAPTDVAKSVQVAILKSNLAVLDKVIKKIDEDLKQP